MSTDAVPMTPTLTVDGGRKVRKNLTRSRIRIALFGLIVGLLVIAGRLVFLGLMDVPAPGSVQASDASAGLRPAILDRNGRELAVDIRAPSMFAEPRRIINVDEAVEELYAEMPELDRDFLRGRLDGDEGFVWLEREITPSEQDRIFNLGIPGIDFVTESKRFYPGADTAAHILGAVDVDNKGIAGIERHIERTFGAGGFELTASGRPQPVNLSIDMRVQHAMHAELADAMERYQAIAAAGVMVDVETGEVIGMVSLPDFDPNDPATALEEGRYNRITAGTYELGSTFKTVTFAAALDSAAVSLTDEFDARFPIRFGRYSIGDFHGKNRILTVPEIFKYSSNIGTIKMMQELGRDNYREFLTRVGFDDPLPIELPETKPSSIADSFSEIAAATAAFGHGLTITPLHMASAVGAFVNDGVYVPATLYPRSSGEAQVLGRRVISSQTSATMRYLLRLNALEGSGSRMNREADGYRVGGKTGTAEKVVDGRYTSEKSLAVFASAFPLDDPQYAMVVLVDEPKRENERSGRTAGWNAGEVTGRIVARAAPMLGIAPDFSEAVDDSLVPAPVRGTEEQPGELEG